MADKGNRLYSTENLLDIVGGAALVLFGIAIAVNGPALFGLVLVAAGVGILVYGIVRRQRLARSDAEPTEPPSEIG